MLAYVEALISEAHSRRKDVRDATISTAFLGGGTPSLLPAALLEQLLAGVLACYPLEEGAEFTAEANPGTLTEDWLAVALQHGVNRISLGMQALQPALLHTLRRIHSFAEVEQSVALCRRMGIRNISLDLMFGLPGQTPAMWRDTLHAAIQLHPQHLSCYGLIPEEGTPLAEMLADGRLSLPSEEAERSMYDDCLDLLAQHGYEQYEISNFALPGYACKHNLGYWRQTPYLGLGASAASMLSCADKGFRYVRQTNPRTIPDYLAMVNSSDLSMRETTYIAPADARFETMMLGLRTTSGVAENDFLQMHGVSLESCYGARLEQLKSRGLLDHREGRWFLTRHGMDIQNSILVDLMDD